MEAELMRPRRLPAVWRTSGLLDAVQGLRRELCSFPIREISTLPKRQKTNTHDVEDEVSCIELPESSSAQNRNPCCMRWTARRCRRLHRSRCHSAASRYRDCCVRMVRPHLAPTVGCALMCFRSGSGARITSSWPTQVGTEAWRFSADPRGFQTPGLRAKELPCTEWLQPSRDSSRLHVCMELG